MYVQMFFQADGVMISMHVWSVVDHRFKPRSGQTKD